MRHLDDEERRRYEEKERDGSSMRDVGLRKELPPP